MVDTVLKVAEVVINAVREIIEILDENNDEDEVIDIECKH